MTPLLLLLLLTPMLPRDRRLADTPGVPLACREAATALVTRDTALYGLNTCVTGAGTGDPPAPAATDIGVELALEPTVEPGVLRLEEEGLAGVVFREWSSPPLRSLLPLAPPPPMMLTEPVDALVNAVLEVWILLLLE